MAEDARSDAIADGGAPGEGAPAARASPFVPFQYPTFRAVWLANLASNFGGVIQSVGAAWLMTSIAGSPDMVALVSASTTLPIMLFSLAAGAAADNFDRRKVMLTAQAFMFSVSVLLTACAYLGLITPWLLLTFTFLIGCGAALNGPAWQSSVGDLVARGDIPAAITLNSVAFNIARSVGPAIGGAVVAAAGAVVAFAANAVSYVALVAVLLRWRPPVAPRLLPREALGLAMSAGIRYVAMSPNIRSVLLRGAAFGVGGVAIQALLPLVARDLVKGGPVTFGLLLGAFGVGAVAGALLIARPRQLFATETIVRFAFVAYAAAAALLGLSTVTAASMAALVVGGASWVLALSTFNATVQLSAPRWVVGRAVALHQMAAFGGMALGAWMWGAAATLVGTEQALLISALVLVGGAALGLRYPLPPLEALNLDPLSRWREPTVAVDLEPRSGPIIVTIEYVIDEADIVPFLNAMAERRRIRRRDGARHWALLRDLTDPRLWVERYDCPTWVEYVRHNQRITQADAMVGERVRALHRGPAPPRVHRMIERQTATLPSSPAHPAHDLAPPLTDTTRSS